MAKDSPEAVAATVTQAVTRTAESIVAEKPRKQSTCAAVREAILTGSDKRIGRTMQALINDRRAPMVAREYARYYLGRDAGDPDQQEMDVMLIQMACR